MSPTFCWKDINIYCILSMNTESQGSDELEEFIAEVGYPIIFILIILK